MKLGRTAVFGISALALSIGAAFAGEDSTHRYHGTGPEWHQSADLAMFNDADSNPEAIADPVVLGNEPRPLHEQAVVIERADTLSMSDEYDPSATYNPIPQ